MAAALVAAAPQPARTQDVLVGQSLPFAVGERLDYHVKVGIAGTVGHGSMWIEGPVEVRGSQTLLLRSTFNARVGWFRAFDRSDSWLDPQRMAVLRFEKNENQGSSEKGEKVDVFPDEQRWANAAGQGGTSPSPASLDELSFIYYVRTLPLAIDSVYSMSRHFDAARNPVTVRAIGRTTVKTHAGTFRVIVVEAVPTRVRGSSSSS
jgi:hypothetical protein